MSIISDHLTDDCMRGLYNEPDRPLDAYEEAAEAAAREHWCDNDLEINDNLTPKDFSMSADGDGCWVRAWVWVSNELMDVAKE